MHFYALSSENIKVLATKLSVHTWPMHWCVHNHTACHWARTRCRLSSQQLLLVNRNVCSVIGCYTPAYAADILTKTEVVSSHAPITDRMNGAFTCRNSGACSFLRFFIHLLKNTPQQPAVVSTQQNCSGLTHFVIFYLKPISQICYICNKKPKVFFPFQGWINAHCRRLTVFNYELQTVLTGLIHAALKRERNPLKELKDGKKQHT